MKQTKAIGLLSGGLDSTTAMAKAIDEGYDIIALGFDYGQRHVIELEASKSIAKTLNIKEHHIVKLGFLKDFGGSALTDTSIPLSENRTEAEMVKETPTTYVPGRGFVFLSVAASLAQSLNISTIITGYVDVDAAGYPDSSKGFVKGFESLLNMGAPHISTGWNLYTPLIDMQKKDVISLGIKLDIDYSQTVTCYTAIEKDNRIMACGKCDSCILRKKGFEDSGVPDPTLYY